MTQFIHCPLDPKGRVLSFQGEAGCCWCDVTTGFSLWGFWAREGREANRCNCRWIGWIVLTAYGISWDCQEIVLHWIIEASCICCKDIGKVRYKIIWVVASGCSQWVSEQLLHLDIEGIWGRICWWVFWFISIEFLFHLLFSFHIEKRA